MTSTAPERCGGMVYRVETERYRTLGDIGSARDKDATVRVDDSEK
jgi:hypothetical protein